MDMTEQLSTAQHSTFKIRKTVQMDRCESAQMSKLAEMERPTYGHPSESGCWRWFQEATHPPQTPKSADAPVLKSLTKKVSTRDLPGGPVVRTPHFQYRGT